MFKFEKRQIDVLKYFYNDTPRKSCRHNSSYNVEPKSTRLSDTLFFVDCQNLFATLNTSISNFRHEFRFQIFIRMSVNRT
jgi:hypothetical protein